MLERLTTDSICTNRPTVINSEVEIKIKERLKVALQSRFAVKNSTFKHVLPRFAVDGRIDQCYGVCNYKSVRIYRA